MQEIALSDLKPTENNVRKTQGSDENMDRLVASIKHNGLLKNLVVKKNGSGYFVTDGNRRLQALLQIHGNNSAETIECKVLEQDANEKEVGLHANMMHEDMHPMDECEAIEAICAEGHGDYDSIAAQFGRTQKWVKQRVKLADLSPLAKEKFRAMEFGISVAEALAMGNHKTQNKFFKEHGKHRYSANIVYNYINGSKIDAKMAIFPTEGHEEALGLEKDLFSDNVFITNQKAFELLTMKHINGIIEERKKKPFKGIHFLNDMSIYDSPKCKNLERPPKRMKDSETVLIIQYMPFKGELSEIRMVEKPVDDKKPTGAVDADGKDVDVPEETPYEYSKPQNRMLWAYYNEFMRNYMFENMDKFDHGKFAMASVCARSIHGYSHSSNIPGHGDFSTSSDFNYVTEVSKDDYTSPVDTAINEIYDRAYEVCKASRITPFQYYYNLDTVELNRILGILAIQSCKSFDFKFKEFRSIYDWKINEKKWFKPFGNWLAKYNTPRLRKLFTILTGDELFEDVKKRDAIKSVLEAFNDSKSKGFNPFKK
ncbi:Helix-turn-helix [uncultured Mediterranean phage uvMED]|nr:Helix-turn-helix [uncultured Mediterranean phage uvMED]BAQ87272.1 Helix-turn-helix [uncultured Mediterranean phage uvMED]BAQ87285.1 Helix-turn-helix [uncultured Mediterranean phage uvMED]